MSEVSFDLEVLEVDDNPLNDKNVIALFGVAAEHEAFGALEIALIELGLWDLHNNRDALYAILKSEDDARISKTHRAALNAFYKLRKQGRDIDPSLIRKYITGVSKADTGPRVASVRNEREYKSQDGSTVAGSTVITIPEYKRRDGTIVPEHERRMPEGFNLLNAKVLADITDEVMEAANSEHKKGDLEWDKKIRDAIKNVVIDGPKFLRESGKNQDNVKEVIRELEASEDNQRFYNLNQTLFHDGDVKRAGLEAAKATTWGARLAAAVDLFIDKTQHQTATVKFAAQAIKEYGPLAGVRMANVYRRYGGYDVPMKAVGDSIVTEMGDVLPQVTSQTASREWAIETLQGRLAGEKAYASGSEPPSEGFIIDGGGNILAHGVGRGSDYFLPFNIQHIKKILSTDRVEYVRSRMVGGPTQEDLHAAMMLGADKLTVVSNSGTYSLDLTQRSHGIKLEHMQVLMRYQEILDQFQNTRGKGKASGELTGAGYDQALEALSNEFPLHLNYNSDSTTRGLWYDYHDYVQPKSRFVDELRRLFGADSNKLGRQKDKWGNVIDPRTRNATPRKPGTSRVDEVLQGERWGTAFRNFEIELSQAGIARGTPDYYRRAITRLTEYRDAFPSSSQARRAIDDKIDHLMNASEAASGVQQTPAVRQGWQADAVRGEMQEILDSSAPGTVVERQVDPNPGGTGPSQETAAWMDSASKRYQNAYRAVGQHFNLESVKPEESDLANLTLELVQTALNSGAPGVKASEVVMEALSTYHESLAVLFDYKPGTPMEDMLY